MNTKPGPLLHCYVNYLTILSTPMSVFVKFLSKQLTHSQNALCTSSTHAVNISVGIFQNDAYTKFWHTHFSDVISLALVFNNYCQKLFVLLTWKLFLSTTGGQEVNRITQQTFHFKQRSVYQQYTRCTAVEDFQVTNI
jgi:hypothetical protein